MREKHWTERKEPGDRKNKKEGGLGNSVKKENTSAPLRNVEFSDGTDRPFISYRIKRGTQRKYYEGSFCCPLRQ